MPSFVLCLRAVLLGIVEGITEWLPISSTGHMLLLAPLLSLEESLSPAFYSFFLVAIQLGAVLAVLTLYFQRLNPLSRKMTSLERKRTWHLWGCVLCGMLPAAVIGIPLDNFFEENLYGIPVIATALLVYGIAFVLIERSGKREANLRVVSVYDLTFRDAFRIGCFQTLSLIPGTSRSGATILGGMLVGVSRTAASEFSFFMAIPVMAGAAFFRVIKFLASDTGITQNEIFVLLSGAVTAFFVSLLAIRALTSYVKRHSFEVFGWYRIALGILVLLFGIFS